LALARSALLSCLVAVHGDALARDSGVGAGAWPWPARYSALAERSQLSRDDGRGRLGAEVVQRLKSLPQRSRLAGRRGERRCRVV